jgi:hypothetical protein
MIPYELIKIFHDKGIDLNRYIVDFYVYGNETKFHEDKFLYDAF